MLSDSYALPKQQTYEMEYRAGLVPGSDPIPDFWILYEIIKITFFNSKKCIFNQFYAILLNQHS